MKIPSSDESKAALTISRITNYKVDFNDQNGEADFLIQHNDKQIGLLEVTTHTEKSLREYDQKFSQESLIFESMALKSNWYISIPNPPNIKNLNEKLIDTLILMEEFEIGDYWYSSDLWALKKDPALIDLVQSLMKLKVESARAISDPILKDQDANTRVAVCPRSGGYVYGGPNSSLELIEKYVSNNMKDLKKLSRFSGENHYWIWLDSFTVQEIRNAFGSDLLPDRIPDLPECIQVLWVADAVSGRIWTNFRSENLVLRNLA